MRRVVVWIAGLLVPAYRRRDWRAEWLAEIHSLDVSRHMALYHTLAAVPDAVMMWKHFWLDSLVTDIRYACRSLIRAPVFSFVVVGTIAVAIAFNSAIFTVTDRVLLRSLPYENPERIVTIYGDNRETGEQFLGTSYPDFNDFTSRERTFEHMAAYRTGSLIHTGTGVYPTRIATATVSENMRALLGAEVGSGRWFTPEEFEPGGSNRALLSDEFRRRHFGPDASPLGRTLQLDGAPFEIVGVLPPLFTLMGRSADIWLPLERRVTDERDNTSADGFGRDWLSLGFLGRIDEGVSTARAEGDLRRIASELEAEYPATNTGRSVMLVPIHEASVGNYEAGLYLLTGAVIVVLLIACVNVANLLIGRGLSRSRELAIRTALGAARARLVRQLVTESVVLATLGGTAGILLGVWMLDALMTVYPTVLPRAEEIALDARIAGVMLAVTLSAGIAFGIVPALHAVKGDVQPFLKEGGRVGETGHRHRLQNALVAGEVMLSTALVAAGVVMLTSFEKIISVDPGFDASSVLTMRLNMPMDRYRVDEADSWVGTTRFFEDLLENVRALPGVESAAMSFANPLEPTVQFPVGIRVHDGTSQARSELPRANIYPVTPGFFETFSIPLLSGRAFASTDQKDSPGVAVVNEAFARKFFGQRNPVGERVDNPPFWAPAGYPTVSEIIGVVGDVRAAGLTNTVPAAIYFPATQTPMGNMRLLVRANNPVELASAVQNEVWKLDDRLPVDGLTTMEDAIAETIAPDRFPVVLVGIFASMSLVLAGLGVYGVTSAAVNERLHELGVRRALGAGAGSIKRLVVMRGSGSVLLGVLLGLGLARVVNRSLRGLVYEVDPVDPLVFFATALILATVGLVAGYLPGRRAALVDPVQVLRN